ncbi:MAG: hypothetical protein IJY11_02810 [Clostridia bacterium]|nr:hypothetical protein [Clostridia bacterium]
MDKNGNTVHSFDNTMNFNSPAKNPEFPILIEATLIKNINSASFTTIQAYTTQEISSND